MQFFVRLGSIKASVLERLVSLLLQYGDFAKNTSSRLYSIESIDGPVIKKKIELVISETDHTES